MPVESARSADRAGAGDRAGLPVRILLAEDNPINQQVVQLLLGRLGHTADIVGNGADAVAAAREHHYDLVLMDVQMPHMDGLEATRLIRSQMPPRRQPWIVALTAGDLAEDRARCRMAGMDDHLSKPVRRAQLQAVLGQLTGTVPPAPDAADQLGRRQALRERLAELCDPDLPNENGLVARLLRSFAGRAPGALDALTEAVDRRDAPAVEHLAHALKGSAANTGAAGLARLCEQIERTGRSGDLTDAPGLLGQAREELREVEPLLVAAAAALRPA